jgi:membrane protease YdiL (CAAX protease family)
MILRRVFYGPSELRAGWRLLIFAAIVYGLLQSQNFAARKWLRGIGNDANFVLFELASFLSFLLASWIMAKLEQRTVGDYGLPGRRTLRGEFWQGAAMGFGSLTVLLVVMRAAGFFYFGRLALHGALIFGWAAAFAVLFLLVALKEEFALRGYALFTLSTGLGFWPSAIALSAYFGFGHRGNSGETWIGLSSAAAFGLLACLMLRRTGNLWLPIGFHTAWDWGQSYFYGVPDSGVVVPGHLLNSSAAGPAWLSGGTVGPEGSVLCLVLMVVIWFAFAAMFPAVKYPDPAALPDPSRPRSALAP